MPSTSVVHPYRWLAVHYDRLLSGHVPWMESARQHILGRLMKDVRSACDLACGTGTLAIALAQNGIQTYGVDLSPSMCRLAREKARQAGVKLRVLRADMRSFQLPEPVDLVTCEADALNHVPSKAGLVQVAQAVARALRPGGHFYFDVNMRLAFKDCWAHTWWLEEPGVVVAMRNGNDSAHDCAWSDIEWFIQEGDLWRRHHERVEEVCWSASEIRRALHNAGFDRIRAWDVGRFLKKHPIVRPGHRTFYLARKAPARG
jgi:SAM-dependent methyltransferase